MNLDLSKILDKICEFEGYRSKPYPCPSGVLTIGYGHTHGVIPGMVISTPIALQFLTYDLLLVFTQLSVVHSNFESFSEGLQFALIDFVFNIGVTKYKNSTLKKVVDSIQNPSCLTSTDKMRISTQLMLWCYSNSTKLKGLEKRRDWEVSLLYSC